MSPAPEPPSPDELRRRDARERTRRDLERRRRREPDSRFTRHLAVLGSVGWPIVALATGGGLIGHALDARWHTGALVTLSLVLGGAALGSWAAWRSVRDDRGGDAK